MLASLRPCLLLAVSLLGSLNLLAQVKTDFDIAIDERVNPWNHLEFANDPDNFQFAVVSDRTGGHRVGVFGDAVEKLNLLQPEFVMSVGDLIEGYLEDTTKLIAQWEEFDSLLQPLEMPFFYLPGNHDISNPVMRRLWEQRLGRRFYHFIYKDVLFITIDTNDGEGVVMSDEQVAYIKQVLAENQQVRWTMLFMHHPIWAYAPEQGFDEVEAALKGRDYTVFAGHTHSYLYSVRQDQQYHVLASTGGGSQLRGPKFSEFDHVTWVTMTDAGPRIVNLMLKGILRQDVVDSTDYRNAQAMIKAADFGHAVFFEDGKMNWREAKPFSVQVQLHNRGERPLKVSGRFFHHHELDLSQAELNTTLAPGSHEVFSFTVTPRKEKLIETPDPLELDWTLSYEQPAQEPEFALEGTYAVTFASSEGLIRSTERPIFLETHRIELTTDLPGANLHYTLDGSEPTARSPRYTSPFDLDASTTVKARLVSEEGRLGEVYEMAYEKVSPRPAPKVKRRRKPGMRYQYFEGNFPMLPDFAELTPLKAGVVTEFKPLAISQRDDHFAIRYEGYIELPVPGIYQFMTYSDDGSKLYVDGELVVDNDGSHQARRRQGRIALEAGVYPIRVDYFEDFEGQRLWAGFGLEGEELKPLAPALTH